MSPTPHTLKRMKHLFLFFGIILSAFVLSACNEDYSAVMNTSEFGLESQEYQSAVICYPLDMEDRVYPAVAISGGFSNTKEQMVDYAAALVENGFIVIGVTPKGNYTTNHTYFKRALTEAFSKLKALNDNPESPVFQRVDVDNMAQVGYSMGGGAALLNAHEDAGDIKAVAAVCPFYPGVKATSLNQVTAPVMLLTGTADAVAWSSYVEKMRDSVLSGENRDRVLYASMEALDHLDVVGGMGEAEKLDRTIETVVAFLKSEMMGDPESESVISGDIQAQHEADGWFSEYLLYEL